MVVPDALKYVKAGLWTAGEYAGKTSIGLTVLLTSVESAERLRHACRVQGRSCFQATFCNGETYKYRHSCYTGSLDHKDISTPQKTYTDIVAEKKEGSGCFAHLTRFEFVRFILVGEVHVRYSRVLPTAPGSYLAL